MDFKLPSGKVISFADNKQFDKWLVSVNIGQKELWVKQGRENEQKQQEIAELKQRCDAYESILALVAKRLEDLALNASEGVSD